MPRAIPSLVALMLLCPRVSWSHSGRSVSLSELVVKGSEISVLLRVAEEDLIEVFGLDGDRDGRLDPSEVERGRTLVADYLRNNLVIRPRKAGAPAQVPCAPALGAIEPPRASSGRRWRFAMVYRCGDCIGGTGCGGAPPAACEGRAGCRWSPAPIEDLEVRCTIFQGQSFAHEHRATVRLAGVERVLLFDARVQTEAVVVPLWSQVGGYLLHGIHHIGAGYDHLVFLLGLLLLGGSFGTLVKIVTSFTVAHSITLALGALELVTLPPIVVESAIALTIAYVGVENFFLKTPEKRWILTFFLGLVHGFGFAGALAESGLPTKGFALTLFSFNLGVEIGQVAVVAAVWPVLRWMRRQAWHLPVMRVTSGGICAFGLVLFTMRAFFDVG